MTNESNEKNSSECRDRRIGCGGQYDRRAFLQISLGTTAAGAVSLPAMAGPFEENEYLKAIPGDKKLDPAWVASLYSRGEKETYDTPESLRNIGMPVGGLFSGTVYLGGDGQLWLWDIFNRDQEGILPRPLKRPIPNASPEAKLVANMTRGGHNYLEPAIPVSPFEQAFFVRVNGHLRNINRAGFSKVTFDGRYPIGRVKYADANCPVEIQLEAFSPFLPMNAADSSLPATVMSYTIENTHDQDTTVEIIGTLQNPICLDAEKATSGILRNRVVSGGHIKGVVCSAESPKESEPSILRDDIVLEDFEKANYEGWTVEGDAFGERPVTKLEVPDYQGDLSGSGDRVVNSHASAPGGDVGEKDGAQGTMTSRAFTINRRYLQFFAGGGAHAGKTCVNLLVDGEIVASRTGQNQNHMHKVEIDVSKYEDREATIQIVDRVSGAWGNIGADHFILTDRPLPPNRLDSRHDFGTMAIVLLDVHDTDRATASGEDAAEDSTGPLDSRLVGRVGRELQLSPGQKAVVTFTLTWHFPNLTVRHMPGQVVGHWYATRFSSALDVAQYISAHFDRLAGMTRKWVDAWYDSSLPYWLLDRTMANTSTLATTTCYRFKNGRFWAWEGIGCCPGTCTHVWHYAQAVGRLFPEIERDQRERVDFGMALTEHGIVSHRSYLKSNAGPAVDGQCGRILGVYREHQMSSNAEFLRRIWPRVKKALNWLIEQDPNLDGVFEGRQENTLDAAWYGKISWISSLYLAALRSGESMAREIGEAEFADKCQRIAEAGSKAILELFNGEYFVQLEDPQHSDKISSGIGCHIDQIFGQTWAHWVGLGHLFDRRAQLSALRSLWKYNFVPDVGTFREQFKRGRWYATAGDAGLIMCSWPKGGQAPNAKTHWQYGYFNECMTGFEWQAAAHMVFEGKDHPDVLQYGLAISRAIHDRYSGHLRNPYNEIECSDHYSRAMASYGVFQAVCGFEHHGPKGHIGFSPRLTPEDFRSAFTAADCWGTFAQKRDGNSQAAIITIHDGAIELRSLVFEVQAGRKVSDVQVSLDGIKIPGVDFELDRNRVGISFRKGVQVLTGNALHINISLA